MRGEVAFNDEAALISRNGQGESRNLRRLAEPLLLNRAEVADMPHDREPAPRQIRALNFKPIGPIARINGLVYRPLKRAFRRERRPAEQSHTSKAEQQSAHRNSP